MLAKLTANLFKRLINQKGLQSTSSQIVLAKATVKVVPDL